MFHLVRSDGPPEDVGELTIIESGTPFDVAFAALARLTLDELASKAFRNRFVQTLYEARVREQQAQAEGGTSLDRAMAEQVTQQDAARGVS